MQLISIEREQKKKRKNLKNSKKIERKKRKPEVARGSPPKIHKIISLKNGGQWRDFLDN